MINQQAIKDRSEWLSWRRNFINASEVAILAGYNKYKSPKRLYLEKIGEISEPESNAAMRRGLDLEDVVIKNAQRAHPDWDIFKPEIYFSDPHSRLGCTPDAIAVADDEHIIIQGKVISRTVFERDFPLDEVNGGRSPPMMYVLQTLAEVMVTGYDHGILAVLVMGEFATDNDYHEFVIPRHSGTETRIREIVAQYWDDVENGRDFKADYTKDAKLLAALFPPDDTVEPLDLTADNRLAEILSIREDRKVRIKEDTDVCEAIDAEIKEKLHGSTKAITSEWKISHVMTHRKEYIVPAKSFPTLRITRTKEQSS